ncbi:hypothetical protein JHL18_04970 [Clostridium sp. YIM B02505]|uniref:Exosortase n=1 Tax=Clostridium yunnanense TaxID=2800325 RepID=A0ABS1EKW3_9CLOT|nr:hypothetical protein [Clostridium yunnanense]MBK1809994.1 hypothetical protein [Clostridium yunnanense]
MRDKQSIKGVGIIAVFLGLVLSKFLASYLGGNAQLMAMSVCGLITILLIMILVFQKHYLGSLFLFIIIAPIYLGIIGAYLDNLYIMGGSTVLFFVVLIAVIKLVPKLKK